MSDSATPWTAAHQTPISMEFPGKNTRVGCHFLQGIFPTQGSNPLAGGSFTIKPPGNLYLLMLIF